MSRQHILLIGILSCVSVFSLVYAVRARSETNAMEYSRNQMGADLSAARAEIQTLSSRIDALTSAAASAPALPSTMLAPTRPVPPERRRAVAQRATRQKSTVDARWKRVESQLAEHKSQLANQRERIAQTQEDVRRTGDQLDGRITSTRDELNRSINTTHD